MVVSASAWLGSSASALLAADRRLRLPSAALAACILAALAMAPTLAWAQDEPNGAGRWTRAVAAATGSGKAADGESLAAALAALPGLHAVIPAAEGADPLEEAARLSCDLAIIADSATDGEGRTKSAWRIVDPATGLELKAGLVEGPEPTPRDLAEFWWLPVVAAAEALLPRPALAGLRVEAAPGTVVTGLGPAPIAVPDSGYVELPRSAPSARRWRAVSKGAYPERGRLNAEPGAVLSIPRRPYKPLSMELGLYMGQFPDLWLGWRLADGFVELKAGAYQFLAGLALADAESEDRDPSYMASLPLIQPGLCAAAYLLPPDAEIRPYLAGTAFARLLVSKAAASPLDSIAPFGLAAAAGAEWSASPRFSLFAELGLAFYPCESGELMAASVAESRGNWGIAYGERWFAEFASIRVGARFAP